MSEKMRKLIVFDGKQWFVRRVNRSVHNLTSGEMEYYCDKHISGPHARLCDVPEVDEVAQNALDACGVED